MIFPPPVGRGITLFCARVAGAILPGRGSRSRRLAQPVARRSSPGRRWVWEAQRAAKEAENKPF